MANVVPLSFYLDNDVDVTCAKVISDAGYPCWSASQAASQRSSDDEQTVYATDKGAVLITHDKEFTNRRNKFPIGRHVRLVCHQLDGPDPLAPHEAHGLASSPLVEQRTALAQESFLKVLCLPGCSARLPGDLALADPPVHRFDLSGCHHRGAKAGDLGGCDPQ